MVKNSKKRKLAAAVLMGTTIIGGGDKRCAGSICGGFDGTGV